MPAEEHGQIIAMGGGGFSMEPDNPLLDDYVLSLSKRQPARVCFIPTASGEAAGYIVRFYRALAGRSIPTDLTFFDPAGLPRRPRSTSDLSSFLDEQDIFYVGGGNTANLLGIWRTHGLDRLLADAFRRGAILCGVSAGMICWFQASVTDSFGELAPLRDGLGLLTGSVCPHYDGDPARRPTYRRLVESGFPAGYAADVGAALHFVGDKLSRAVSSREGAAAYRVEMRDGQLVEERLDTHFLGASRPM
jgi:peptidase E